MDARAESLSLVICTYRRPNVVRRLLSALNEQSALPNEVLIIDASPDDERGVAWHAITPAEVLRNIRSSEQGLSAR